MVDVIVVNSGFDKPDKRDYTLEEFIKIKEQEESAEAADVKRPREEIELQNQWQVPACTVFGATHFHNWLNILEDRKYWKTRTQAKAKLLRDAFCKYRGTTIWWSAIQTVANWFKLQKYVAGYVSIPNSTPLDKMVLQMKQAIDMGMFIYSGSAFGNWKKMAKTWIYEESNPQYFLWHAYAAAVSYELKSDWTVDYFWAANSYWSNWWPYAWYFKIYAKDVKKLYTKIVFLDFDDKAVFDKLQEVEKVKQAVWLLREVYALGDNPVKKYLESIKMSENFSKIYNTTI